MFHSLSVWLQIIVSEWLLFDANSAIFQLYQGKEQVTFIWDDGEVRFILSWIFYSASWLKQQSVDRHVASLGHIILITSQPVFVLTPYHLMLRGEAANTNFIVFGVTRPGLEPTIYCTLSEHANHCTTDTITTDYISCTFIVDLNFFSLWSLILSVSLIWLSYWKLLVSVTSNTL
jgi:hypothetical protein